jgi:inorganic pyrophosphatase
MKYFQALAFVFLLSIFGCKTAQNLSINYQQIVPINADETVNMVIEIPAGSTAKYEMNKVSYVLEMDSLDNQPRFIDYLGYPGNYGMIPNTILPKNMGGDGDPLDVLLLGPAQKRGSVIKVKVIGVLHLLDNGEKDDKLIAIDPNSPWKKVDNLNELDIYYPGTKTIIATFFQNYKGIGQMELQAWSGKTKALQFLQESTLTPITK